MNFENKKILITGGAGFIGLHLSKRLLERGFSVDLVDDFSRGVCDSELETLAKQPGVNIHSCDITMHKAFDDFNYGYYYIFHCAAIVGVSNVLKMPYNVLSKNLSMLVNLLDFASKQSMLKRLMFISSSEVYAGTLQNFDLPIPTPESVPIALTDIAHPRTSYMLSKIYGEALCLHSGLPCTILRPHNIYGPRMGMAHVIPELLRKAYISSDGGNIEVFSINHKRTFCYIDDAVEMMILCLESPDCRGQIMNIGNQDTLVTMQVLAEIIIDVINKEVKIDPKPSTPGSPHIRCPDMNKTYDLINYKCLVGLEEGIELTYKWYLKNVFNTNRCESRSRIKF